MSIDLKSNDRELSGTPERVARKVCSVTFRAREWGAPLNGGIHRAGDNGVTAKLSMTSPLIPLRCNDLLARRLKKRFT